MAQDNFEDSVKILILIGSVQDDCKVPYVMNSIKAGLQKWLQDMDNDAVLSLDECLAAFPEECKKFCQTEALAPHTKLTFTKDNVSLSALLNPTCVMVNNGIAELMLSPCSRRLVIYGGHFIDSQPNWVFQDGVYAIEDLEYVLIDKDITSTLLQTNVNSKITVCCCDADKWKLVNEEALQVEMKFIDPFSTSDPEAPSLTLSQLDFFVDFLKDNMKNKVQGIFAQLSPPKHKSFLRTQKPSIYIFPSGNGDSAFFKVDRCNVLINGGALSRPWFWQLIRHEYRVDCVIGTHLSCDNLTGMNSFLLRKLNEQKLKFPKDQDCEEFQYLSKFLLSPELGAVFINSPAKFLETALRKTSEKASDDVSTPGDVTAAQQLNIRTVDVVRETFRLLKALQVEPKPLTREGSGEPITLFYKYGIGKLQLFVLNPGEGSKELEYVRNKWGLNQNSVKLTTKTGVLLPSGDEGQSLISDLASICCLLVWCPASTKERIIRVLFPGNASETQVFEGLEKLNHCEFLLSPSPTGESTLEIDKHSPVKGLKANASKPKPAGSKPVRGASAKPVVSTAQSNKPAPTQAARSSALSAKTTTTKTNAKSTTSTVKSATSSKTASAATKLNPVVKKTSRVDNISGKTTTATTRKQASVAVSSKVDSGFGAKREGLGLTKPADKRPKSEKGPQAGAKSAPARSKTGPIKSDAEKRVQSKKSTVKSAAKPSPAKQSNAGALSSDAGAKSKKVATSKVSSTAKLSPKIATSGTKEAVSSSGSVNEKEPASAHPQTLLEALEELEKAVIKGNSEHLQKRPSPEGQDHTEQSSFVESSSVDVTASPKTPDDLIKSEDESGKTKKRSPPSDYLTVSPKIKEAQEAAAVTEVERASADQDEAPAVDTSANGAVDASGARDPEVIDVVSGLPEAEVALASPRSPVLAEGGDPNDSAPAKSNDFAPNDVEELKATHDPDLTIESADSLPHDQSRDADPPAPPSTAWSVEANALENDKSSPVVPSKEEAVVVSDEKGVVEHETSPIHEDEPHLYDQAPVEDNATAVAVGIEPAAADSHSNDDSNVHPGDGLEEVDNRPLDNAPLLPRQIERDLMSLQVQFDDDASPSSAPAHAPAHAPGQARKYMELEEIPGEKVVAMSFTPDSSSPSLSTENINELNSPHDPAFSPNIVHFNHLDNESDNLYGHRDVDDHGGVTSEQGTEARSDVTLLSETPRPPISCDSTMTARVESDDWPVGQDGVDDLLDDNGNRTDFASDCRADESRTDHIMSWPQPTESPCADNTSFIISDMTSHFSDSLIQEVALKDVIPPPLEGFGFEVDSVASSTRDVALISLTEPPSDAPPVDETVSSLQKDEEDALEVDCESPIAGDDPFLHDRKESDTQDELNSVQKQEKESILEDFLTGAPDPASSGGIFDEERDILFMDKKELSIASVSNKDDPFTESEITIAKEPSSLASHEEEAASGEASPPEDVTVEDGSEMVGKRSEVTVSEDPSSDSVDQKAAVSSSMDEIPAGPSVLTLSLKANYELSVDGKGNLLEQEEATTVDSDSYESAHDMSSGVSLAINEFDQVLGHLHAGQPHHSQQTLETASNETSTTYRSTKTNKMFTADGVDPLKSAGSMDAASANDLALTVSDQSEVDDKNDDVMSLSSKTDVAASSSENSKLVPEEESSTDSSSQPQSFSTSNPFVDDIFSQDPPSHGGHPAPKREEDPSMAPERPGTYKVKKQAPSASNGKKNPIFHFDLAYIPHHGNKNHCGVEFFKRIRSKYYVLSGFDAGHHEPSSETLEAMLQGKRSWKKAADDEDNNVAVIPTHNSTALFNWYDKNHKDLNAEGIHLVAIGSKVQMHDEEIEACKLEL